MRIRVPSVAAALIAPAINRSGPRATSVSGKGVFPGPGSIKAEHSSSEFSIAMNDVATRCWPQAAHRRIYEPKWTTDSVSSNPHAVQASMVFIAKHIPSASDGAPTTPRPK
ncbi:hypothetical protein AGR3A_Lc140250 [Agrobacterium tomkonis CFBP 6623]|uniref:Uncharacterized protein n=1 Tax=Agrobacterium tomkonis CFBP 6623 TaxID=1183432 RepID=A0A1S7RRI0_9HYPH|nr:hypothetical protein AGR3A_Lc140250 [Agrobacterium tomkonis CFBP 6623]